MVDTPPQISPPECSTPGQVVRSKRQKLDGVSDDMVRLLPLSKQPDLLAKGWRPVQLSKHDKAPGMTLSDDQHAVTSCKGYRMVRCTHGVHSGTHYFEVKITSLGSSGHCRVGWAKKQAELQAPVGYDHQSFSYRDMEGSKVHRALREPYGEPYNEGDVIGCLLHLPPGGRSLEPSPEDVVQWKGAAYVKQEASSEPQTLAGNGVWQGTAYENIPEGTYYPALSLYTLPHQRQGATLTVNFGPTFDFPPPPVDGVPTAAPMCEAAGSQSAVAAEQMNEAGAVHVKQEPPTVEPMDVGTAHHAGTSSIA